MSLFATYPYLIESCIILLLSLCTLRIMPEYRRVLLASGLAQLPAAAAATYVFVPTYWDPNVIDFPFICLENVVWAMSCGILIWFFAAFPFRGRLSRPGRTMPAAILRVAAFHVSCGVLFSLLRLTVLTRPRDLMAASLLPAVVAALVLGVRLPRELPLAVAGSLGYAGFHFLDMRFGYWLWPSSGDAFQAEAELPWRPGGVPGWEVLWAVCIGFAWPLIFSWIMGIRLLPRNHIHGET